MLRRSLCVLMLCSSSVSLAESFITDSITVGIYSDSDLSGQPITRLKSGVPVEVLESQGEMSRIKTEHGETGWLRSTFLNTRTPVVKQLEIVRGELAQLESELEEAQSKNNTLAQKEAEASKSVRWMRAEMNKARKEVTELEDRLKSINAEDSKADEQVQQVQQSVELLRQEKADLERRLAATLLINETAVVPENRSESSVFLWGVIGLLLGVVTGAAASYAWLDQRLRKRFGGIRFH